MKKIFSIIASAMLIASCTSQTEELVTPIPESQEPEGQKVTLCASIASGEELPVGARNVSGKDSNPGSTTGVINLTWDEGDEVLIKVGEESAVFTLSGGAGTNMGSFTGVMPGDGSSYDVVYPADYNEAVLAEQTYVENGFGKGLMKMSTKTAGTVAGGFTLSADNALLGLQLTGNDELGKIVLSNPADSKTYTLTCTGVKLTSEAKMFYIVVPAGEWANGFNVSVYASDDTRIGLLSKGSSATFAASTSMVMPVQEPKIGFSVSEGKQVTFSPGNLQFTRSTNTWSFAEKQYEVIGIDNVIGGSVKYNANHSYTRTGTELADKIDLFGWSGSEGSIKFGVSTSKDNAAYSGTFVDWGENEISGYAPGTWRTLTHDEWKYLLFTRKNANSLRCTATVTGVKGLILLPDNWVCPAGAIFNVNDESQSFTSDQWSDLEKEDAVFLPAAGYRYGFEVNEVPAKTAYWSATVYDSNTAPSGDSRDYDITAFWSNVLGKNASNLNYYLFAGFSVRLVKDL